MRALTKHPRAVVIAIPLVLFAVFLVVPAPAHAEGGWFDWVPNPVDMLLDVGVSAVAVVNALLGQLLNLAKYLLTFVLQLSLELILGLKVIDVAWNLMRDMANLVFVLMLILISFSTIFNVVKGLQRFHYRTALMPVIIAALMMNFSLAIGKAGVLAFDRVARIFINIMPNLGGDLTKALQPQALVLDPKGLVGPLPSNDEAAKGIVKGLTTAEDKRLKECLNEERPVVSGDSGDVVADFLVWADDKIYGPEPGRKGLGDCNLEIIAARQGAYKVAAGQITTEREESALAKVNASTPNNTQEQKIFLIFSGVLSGMLIFLLSFCLLAPCGFLLLRVIMLWVLLFSSPIAWASYAIPGTDFFKKWWSLFIGWNAFGPVYLFVLIPGMIVLSRSGEMLTALGNSAASGTVLGTASGLFQIFMFNAFAVLIFLGGLGVAMKSSFAGAVKTSGVLGDLAGKTGALDATGTAAARLAGRATGRAAGAVGRYTGATAYGEAAIARAKQAGQGVLDRSRLAQIVKPTSYEEKLAAAKKSFGVTGGAAEFQALKAGQVKTAGEDLEKQTAGMLSAQKNNYLRERMNSPNQAIALAAREGLLKSGALSASEIADTRRMYPVGPARAEFVKRADAAAQQVKRKAGAAIAAKKKEAKEARDDLITEISSKSYPDGAAVSAELAKLTDPDDIRAAQEAIGKKAPAQLLDHLTGGGSATPAQYSQAFESVLKDKETLMKLGPKYFDPATPTSEFRDLQSAINNRYPKGAAVGTPAYLAREKYKDALIDARPSMQAKIEDLFT